MKETAFGFQFESSSRQDENFSNSQKSKGVSAVGGPKKALAWGAIKNRGMLCVFVRRLSYLLGWDGVE